MSVLRPFRAVRPAVEYAARVAALPYDVMNSTEARKMTENEPYSFLHIDKAEIDLPEDVGLYDACVYAKAAENLKRFIKDGIFITESEPSLYIYRLVMDGREQTGIVGCASAEEYLNGKIKKHEHTRADKEEDRIRHVSICDANTGPIFLTYRRREEISGIIKRETEGKPLYDFVSDDGIRHTVWRVGESAAVQLQKEFSLVDCLYIADGHHRCASAVRVSQLRRAENPTHTGEEEYNYFLSVIFPDDCLKVFDYNRVVRDLNGLAEEEFLEKLSAFFEITPCVQSIRPLRRHTFGLYMGKCRYMLALKEGLCDEADPTDRLDVSVLQKLVLGGILGIDDPRSSDRIAFVGGIRGLGELEKRVDSGEMKAAFAMFPTTVTELMDIADAGRVMPPKSTWFEPKLRSGLFIHTLR